MSAARRLALTANNRSLASLSEKDKKKPILFVGAKEVECGRLISSRNENGRRRNAWSNIGLELEH
jgi:hypothetical protein